MGLTPAIPATHQSQDRHIPSAMIELLQLLFGRGER
jgi:hypothetical protein